MQPVTARMHALLARELITACGGLDETAGVCRLKKSRLSECQTPDSGAYLPMDVVAELEAYCGQPIYTRAVADARPAAIDAGESLADEACEAAEEAVSLQALVRGFVHSQRPLKGLTPKQKAAIDAEVLILQRKLAEVLATVDGGRS